MSEQLLDRLLEALPQTQCEACGFKGCRPYAQAVLQGESINLCAPGGQKVALKLHELTGGLLSEDVVNERYVPPKLAVIDQKTCIGCTKCIAPCPTDAIVGARKLNHYVLSADCSGCGLCVDYCPVDCISMELDQLSDDGKYALRSEYRRLNDQKINRPKHQVKSKRRSILEDLIELRNESS